MYGIVDRIPYSSLGDPVGGRVGIVDYLGLGGYLARARSPYKLD